MGQAGDVEVVALSGDGHGGNDGLRRSVGGLLADWREEVWSASRPANIFNATLVDTGERLLLGAFPNGRITALAFDAAGVPSPRETPESAHDLLELMRAQPADHAADLDGDGNREILVIGPR